MTPAKWKGMVDAAFASEHVQNVTWTNTNNGHRLVRGEVSAPGGRMVPITLTVSSAPGDPRAIQKVRCNLRTAIRNARRCIA